MTLVENVTDVNDKIYEAAAREGVYSTGWRRRPLAGTWRTPTGSVWAVPTPGRSPPRPSPEIVGLIEELVARELAYEASGDVYFRVAPFPNTAGSPGAAPTRWSRRTTT